MRPGLVLLVALTTALCAPALARAAEAPAAPDSAPLKELPDLVLEPWLSTQTLAGNFRRPSGTLLIDGYANAGLAYAMLLEAVRSGDERYFASAMRTFAWINRTRYPMEGVFYQLFSAAAYNLAVERFASRNEFKRIRPGWADRIRRFRYLHGLLGSRYRYNKNLVEALEVIELYRTRLTSKAPKAILRDRRTAITRAIRLLNVQLARRVLDYTVNAGTKEGWPFAERVSLISDPPANPPAYNALTAALYMRAYERLPAKLRTVRMLQTAERMIGGVIARVAPDGDLAFDGRSQEQAWALSSGAYAAWAASRFERAPSKDIHLSFARRVVGRLETVHVTPESSFGFVLTPAAGCCDRQDMPPGQDHYYDVGKYSGLTAMTMGWALGVRPAAWGSATALLPTDRPSNFVYELGRGRFYQHRGDKVYWLLRMQSDYYDARADMGLALLKIRADSGAWIDAVPPRPYTGGHHRPPDPAAPCLLFRLGCAYLDLSEGRPVGESYVFRARWRTARGSQIRSGTATVTPTASGLRLSWTAKAKDRFRVDTFLSRPLCASSGGVTTAHVAITITGQKTCEVFTDPFAGGALTTMRKARLKAEPRSGLVQVTYRARVD